MIRRLLFLLFLALGIAVPTAQAQTPNAPEHKPFSTPTEIVAAAPASDWVKIDTADLLVMDLAPDAKGHSRRVVIQLMPPPFSQGWVGNIRKLAAAHWWDGLSVNRVQDNYVTQWGDPDGDDPKLAKKLPDGMVKITQGNYVRRLHCADFPCIKLPIGRPPVKLRDAYSFDQGFYESFPTSTDGVSDWPTHCYGMVGVGRDYPPDTGTGAELYTVIGTPPRQLDRNIALVGRVIEGMEWMSSLPRGHGTLGFYDTKQGDERVPILRVRLATDLPAADQPQFEYLSTESASFAKYADARANRRDPFYIHPAGGVDICNVPVPIRRAK